MPHLSRPIGWNRSVPAAAMIWLAVAVWIAAGATDAVAEDRGHSPDAGEIRIERAAPWQGVGKAYRLIYRVAVPVNLFWRLKTDFGADFQTTHRFIETHRLVRQQGNVAVTANQYTHRPGMTFIWETTQFPRDRRLEYRLLNPKACKHRFHFGTIEIEADGAQTRVVQTAYFDFSGVWWWYHNPWKGGMRDFLRTTARWEQETALRLKARYGMVPGTPK